MAPAAVNLQLPCLVVSCPASLLVFQPTITQMEKPIETVIDLFVMGHCDSAGIPLGGQLAQQVHDVPGPLGIERRRRFAWRDN
ncbi:MAG: hypothetical protein RLZZ444_1660 [Pseudomonadota bacterium]|jgi:hypothetical protein